METVELTEDVVVDVGSLDAGREMDALVAEIMGYQVIETDDCNGEDNFWLSKDGQHPFEYEYGGQMMLPLYSKTISAAWEVVEKGQSLLDCWVKISLATGKGWRVELCGCYSNGSKDYGVQDMKGEATAPTTPLAICRAFLKAVMKA